MSSAQAVTRLAIVNRGEAALRCIRAVKTLRALDGEALQAIALYTDVDRDAPFVRQADAAHRLPAPRGPVAGVNGTAIWKVANISARYLDLEFASAAEVGRVTSIFPRSSNSIPSSLI